MTDKKYVIGVDGGNSKTDYFLFDMQGDFIDHIHAGTCSHERFSDGYASAYRVMNENIQLLLARNQLTMDHVATGAFGLAGADLPSQKASLCEIVERIGFARYALDNDSFLGIKAGSDKGFGVCSINGSGTCTGGISPSGKRLQVGGMGSELFGDEAGGYYLARKVLRAVYDYYYRSGPKTSMTDPVMELLQIPDKEAFAEATMDYVLARSLPNTELMQIMFSAADQGDRAAIGIIDNTAKQLAHSTVGCMHNLDFGTDVDVILAGSVWVKAESPLLFEKYADYVEQLTRHRCHFVILQVPPATGAVLWALELAWGRPVDSEIRRNIIDTIMHL